MEHAGLAAMPGTLGLVAIFSVFIVAITHRKTRVRIDFLGRALSQQPK